MAVGVVVHGGVHHGGAADTGGGGPEGEELVERVLLLSDGGEGPARGLGPR